MWIENNRHKFKTSIPVFFEVPVGVVNSGEWHPNCANLVRSESYHLNNPQLGPSLENHIISVLWSWLPFEWIMRG